MKKTLVVLAGLALAAALAGGAAAKNPQLWIVHVQKGCHVWSNGTQQAATMQLALRRGTTLTIVNQDIDMHQLVQLAGPRLAVAGKVLMMHPVLIRFTKAGVYRFTTKPREMAGMPDAKTTGPDNILRLTVRVT
jgi:plastocyanin